MANENSIVYRAMNFGAIFGGVLVILAMLDIMVGRPGDLTWAITNFFITLVVYFGALTFLGITYRKKVREDAMSFGESFAFLLMLIIFGTMIAALFHFAFTQWIDPEYLRIKLEATREMTLKFLYEHKAKQADIDDVLKKLDEAGVPTPAKYTWAILYQNFIFGVIASLIVSFFIKKEAPMFVDNSSDNKADN